MPALRNATTTSYKISLCKRERTVLFSYVIINQRNQSKLNDNHQELQPVPLTNNSKPENSTLTRKHFRNDPQTEWTKRTLTVHHFVHQTVPQTAPQTAPQTVPQKNTSCIPKKSIKTLQHSDPSTRTPNWSLKTIIKMLQRKEEQNKQNNPSAPRTGTKNCSQNDFLRDYKTLPKNTKRRLAYATRWLAHYDHQKTLKNTPLWTLKHVQNPYIKWHKPNESTKW